MTNYEHIAHAIVAYQKRLVGPVAIILASKVPDLQFSDNMTPKISGEPKAVINQLVSKYEFLWGRLGVYECKEAASAAIRTLQKNEIPERLLN